MQCTILQIKASTKCINAKESNSEMCSGQIDPERNTSVIRLTLITDIN